MLVSLNDAAKILNYSVSGLRKLVTRRAIKFYQRTPHAPIKFKREWLDEFVADGTSGPGDLSPVKRRAKVKTVASSDFVDLSLFKI